MLSGCGGKAAARPPVEAYAQQLVSSGALNAIAFASDHGRDYFASAGTPRPSEDEHFPIGSVTKAFTATITLQLVQEKRLQLDGTLGHYLPGVVRYGNSVTIRELLQHRSGLSDFTDETFKAALAVPSAGPIDALRIAGSRPLEFKPGTLWSYSNTNYIALGLIIEKVTRRTYAHELQTRILTPLGLHATSLSVSRRVADPTLPLLTPSLAWTAGGIVSDVRDLARFFSALVSGRLISRSTLVEMERTVSVGGQGGYAGDGLGIFVMDTPCGRFWGHSGAFPPGYYTLVDASAARARTVIAVAKLPSFERSWIPPEMNSLLCTSVPS